MADSVADGYKGYLNSKGRVVIVDGGTALHQMIAESRPDVARIRCHRHLLADLASSNAKAMFEKLRKISPDRREDVCLLHTSPQRTHGCSPYTDNTSGRACVVYGMACVVLRSVHIALGLCVLTGGHCHE